MRSTLILLLITLLFTSPGIAIAQNSAPQAPAQTASQSDDETVRINTNLIQTDVSVFDRRGKSVGELKQSDFELKVDGKPQSLSFFERVATNGDTITTASDASPASDTSRTSPFAQPRIITFFVDDLHLTPETVGRTRQVLYNFIDKQLPAGTQAMIVAASGQTGFLSQPTDDKTLLKAAVKRITYQTRSALGTDATMSEYQAVLINRGDPQALAYQVQQYIYAHRPSSPPPSVVENIVRNSARLISRQAATLSTGIVSNLESVVRSFPSSPARRIVFFISNGFSIDNTEADVNYRLRRVTDQAARRGVVIYTLDPRGLIFGMIDASNDAVSDIANINSSQLPSNDPNEDVRASQSVLRSLADDTGGRALLNKNALESLVSGVVNETSNYYLLGWRPEVIDERTGEPKFRRITVSVKGHPELKVRARRGFFNRPVRDASTNKTANGNTPAATPNAALNSALNAFYPRRDVPLALYTAFTNDAKDGAILTAAVQLTNDAPVFTEPAKEGNARQATINLACVVLDEAGKPVYSAGRDMQLAPNPDMKDSARVRDSKLVANFAAPILKPGLYQFRVAARDPLSGRVGSAFQWTEVPDFKPGKIALSSLFIVELSNNKQAIIPASNAAASNSMPSTVALDVARDFRRTSRLLLQLFIYNAARGSGGAGAAASPDVTMELQVKRGDQVIINAPTHAVSLTGITDMTRIPYAAAIPLRSLAPGIYTLQATATDRTTHKSIMQKIDFTVQ